MRNTITNGSLLANKPEMSEKLEKISSLAHPHFYKVEQAKKIKLKHSKMTAGSNQKR